MPYDAEGKVKTPALNTLVSLIETSDPVPCIISMRSSDWLILAEEVHQLKNAVKSLFKKKPTDRKQADFKKRDRNKAKVNRHEKGVL